MSRTLRLVILALVLVAVAGTLYLKLSRRGGDELATTEAGATQALPRLLELGSDQCIPCKKMAPILAELKTEYADQFVVDFIDVWRNVEASKEYDVRVIPTQVFYDAEGQELYRHEGFFAKESILNKWRDLGVKLAMVPPKGGCGDCTACSPR